MPVSQGTTSNSVSPGGSTRETRAVSSDGGGEEAKHVEAVSCTMLVMVVTTWQGTLFLKATISPSFHLVRVCCDPSPFRLLLKIQSVTFGVLCAPMY